MNKLIKKNIIALCCYIVVTSVLIVGLLVLFSLMKTRTMKVLEVKEQVISYEKNKKVFNEEYLRVEDLAKRVSLLESFVINDEKVPNLLSSLESLAKDIGVEFEIKSVQNPIEEDIKKLTIEAEIVGTEINVKKFLNKIQKQPFVVDFKDLVISSVEKEVIIKNQIDAKNPSYEIVKSWQAFITLEILSY